MERGPKQRGRRVPPKVEKQSNAQPDIEAGLEIIAMFGITDLMRPEPGSPEAQLAAYQAIRQIALLRYAVCEERPEDLPYLREMGIDI